MNSSLSSISGRGDQVSRGDEHDVSQMTHLCVDPENVPTLATDSGRQRISLPPAGFLPSSAASRRKRRAVSSE